MATKITYAVGSHALGAGSEGTASLLILQVESATSVAVHGRVAGSGITRAPVSIKKRLDDSVLAAIVAAGIYEVNIAGLDVSLEVTGGVAVLSYSFVAG